MAVNKCGAKHTDWPKPERLNNYCDRVCFAAWRYRIIILIMKKSSECDDCFRSMSISNPKTKKIRKWASSSVERTGGAENKSWNTQNTQWDPLFVFHFLWIFPNHLSACSRDAEKPCIKKKEKKSLSIAILHELRCKRLTHINVCEVKKKEVTKVPLCVDFFGATYSFYSQQSKWEVCIIV